MLAASVTVTDLIEFINQVKDIYASLGIGAAIGLPFFETLIPIAPLFLMISFNVLSYGLFFGFLFTYIGTCAATILIFMIMRTLKNKTKESERSFSPKVAGYLNWIDRTHPMLHILAMMIPLSPAYLINYSMGLSDVKFSTYLLVTLTSRFLMLIFCLPFVFTLLNLYESGELGGVQGVWLLIFGCIVIAGIVVGQKMNNMKLKKA